MTWLVALALADPVTDGEVPPLTADVFRPSVDNPWMLTVDESGHGPLLHTNARLLVSYANRPLAYTGVDGDPQALVEHVQREDTLVATTLGRFRLGTTLPYYAYVDGEAGRERCLERVGCGRRLGIGGRLVAAGHRQSPQYRAQPQRSQPGNSPLDESSDLF